MCFVYWLFKKLKKRRANKKRRKAIALRIVELNAQLANVSMETGGSEDAQNTVTYDQPMVEGTVVHSSRCRFANSMTTLFPGYDSGSCDSVGQNYEPITFHGLVEMIGSLTTKVEHLESLTNKVDSLETLTNEVKRLANLTNRVERFESLTNKAEHLENRYRARLKLTKQQIGLSSDGDYPLMPNTNMTARVEELDERRPSTSNDEELDNLTASVSAYDRRLVEIEINMNYTRNSLRNLEVMFDALNERIENLGTALNINILPTVHRRVGRSVSEYELNVNELLEHEENDSN